MLLHVQAGLQADATKLALNLETDKQRSLTLQLAIKYEQGDTQGAW